MLRKYLEDYESDYDLMKRSAGKYSSLDSQRSNTAKLAFKLMVRELQNEAMQDLASMNCDPLYFNVYLEFDPEGYKNSTKKSYIIKNGQKVDGDQVVAAWLVSDVLNAFKHERDSWVESYIENVKVTYEINMRVKNALPEDKISKMKNAMFKVFSAGNGRAEKAFKDRSTALNSYKSEIGDPLGKDDVKSGDIVIVDRPSGGRDKAKVIRVNDSTGKVTVLIDGNKTPKVVSKDDVHKWVASGNQEIDNEFGSDFWIS